MIILFEMFEGSSVNAVMELPGRGVSVSSAAATLQCAALLPAHPGQIRDDDERGGGQVTAELLNFIEVDRRGPVLRVDGARDRHR